jgi:thioredoxin:protein disulfide reductase
VSRAAPPAAREPAESFAGFPGRDTSRLLRSTASLRRLLRRIALAALLLSCGVAAAADEPPIPAEIVRLKVESASYRASERALDVVVRAEIAPGWHVNAHRPKSGSLIPTTLTVDPAPGFTVGEIGYPEPETLALAFAGGERLEVYSGRVPFRVPLAVNTELSAEGARFRAKLHFQACDDTRCLRPADTEREFFVRRPGDPSAQAGDAAGNEAPVERWLLQRGLLSTLALVFVMGLGLNLTPCVYPLIAVTVAYFGSQAGERRTRTLLLSSAYALGIAVTFSVIGVAAALSGGLFGRALQDPRVLAGVASLMVALALSCFGLYTLQPPAWVLQRVGGSTPGVAGAALMGLTMGVVAAPCVGPIVVGLLVAVGSRGDPGLGFLLFFTLALGLGAPYVALGAAAGSIVRLPRAGEWMVWVERLFGFVLLGLALYFVSPLLAPPRLRYAQAALLAAAGVTLGLLDRRGPGPVVYGKRAAGVLAVLTALWIALPRTQQETAPGIPWREYSAAALDQARSEGRPAVVDFRADWCLPCVEMERTTFVSPQVRDRASTFAMLRADVTEMSKEAEKMLSQYGVLGVPTTIFFGPDGSERRRMVGYIGPEEFVQLLDQTDDAGQKAARGRDAAAS